MLRRCVALSRIKHQMYRAELHGIKMRLIASAAAPRGKRWAALWGNGDHGRLGLASRDSQWEPVLLRSLKEHDPCAIACGGAHTLILTGEGRVFATGLNDSGQLGMPPDTRYITKPIEVVGLPDFCVQVAAGYYHSAAISGGGEVYVWGGNSHGQLGLGKKAEKVVWRPQKITSLEDVSVRMLAFGSEHSLALTEDGEVLSWGAGKDGQLGHGQPPNAFRFFQNLSEHSPRLIKSLQGIEIYKIAAGLLHSACINEHGILYTFGQGRLSQLGMGNEIELLEPHAVTNLPPVEHVACGGYHTGTITRAGDLYMWGANEYGCLGFGYRHQYYTAVPIKVEGSLVASQATQISCGWKHTAAIIDGQIFMWGWGGSQGSFSIDGHSSGGQLGLGNEFDYPEPTLVTFRNSSHKTHVIQVSCGFNHTGAIIEEEH